MMDTRNRPSTISRLPPQIKEKIASLRDQGRTLDEIMNALNAMDVEISRSALGRYTKRMDRVATDLRKSRELAQAVARQFGDKEVSQVARTNMELTHTLLMKLMVGNDDEESAPVILKPQEAMFIATAIEKLTKAGKVDFEAQLLAAREQERREATAQAAEKAADTARSKGLSEDLIHAIKANILGVDP
jgi:hypothetical protein